MHDRRRKRLEQLKTELARMERTFVAHHDVPGHPDFCVQQSVQIKVWDCLLGSPESPANVWVDWTASLDHRRCWKALRMAIRMEYDVRLASLDRGGAELGSQEVKT